MSQVQLPMGAPARPVARGNRRATIRYRCAPATIGKIVGQDDHEFQRAWILDLSLQGIGIQLSRALTPGRLIIVLIRGNDSKKIFELPAKVMHCSVLPQGDYFVGCELTDLLSADDLEQLL